MRSPLAAVTDGALPHCRASVRCASQAKAAASTQSAGSPSASISAALVEHGQCGAQFAELLLLPLVGGNSSGGIGTVIF